MKKVVLSIVVAVISITAVTAQTLYVEPMYVGGDAVFEVSGGTPGAAVIICASVGGMGPTTLSSGVTLSLSTPLRPLPTIFVDVLGRSVLGPIPLPDNVSVGMQVWFQAVHLDVWSNPIATVSNMVPVSIQSDPIPGMVYINGSTFEMGDHFNVGSGSERPVHSVTLNSFFLDEHEVSNLQFANYLNAELAASNVLVSGGGVYQVSVLGHQICELADGLSYSNGQIVVAAGKEQHPVVRVTWYGAALYCNYSSAENLRQPCYDPLSFACDYSVDGFRLPTEAEYEFASRGGEHSPYFLYSWGSDSVTSGDANYGNTINSTVTRGSYAANNYGLFDISGNAAEWCNDWYMSGYYDVSELINPVGPIFGTNRVARGGGWNASASDLRSAKRDFYNPMVLHPYVGFRVATQG